MRRLIPFGLLCLILAACGGTGGSEEGDPRPSTPEQGALAFHAQGIEAEAVRSMWVEMTPDPANSPYKDNPVYLVPLSLDGREWRSEAKDFYVGAYSVRVFAFDKFIGEEAVVDLQPTAIFSSAARRVDVQQNQHKTVTFLLYEQGAEDRQLIPRFLAVEFDRALVEQWEKLGITVDASGGEAPLRQLRGGFLPGDVPGTAPGSAGLFGPAANFQGGNRAWIEWTPPRREDTYSFLLGISNERGDEAELGVSVPVGLDIGDIDFHIHFNHAPEARVLTRLDNSDDGTSVHLTTTFTDPEQMDIHYEWTHNCPADFRWQSVAPTGTVSHGDTVVFDLSDVVPGGRPGRIYDPAAVCVLRLALEDTGGSKRLQRLEIPIGMLQPGIGGP